jgi:hypothetical protein
MRLTLFALACAPLFASPLACPPDFVNDGRAVDPSCSGIAANVYALPGSTWSFSFEDVSFAEQHPDGDYNDLWGTLKVNALGTRALVTFGGSLAARWNTLLLGGSPLFFNLTSNPGDSVTIATTPWAAIPLELSSFGFTDAGQVHLWTYQMGTIQDWAVCMACETEVPEPSPFGVVGLTLLIGDMVMIRRRAS